MRGYPGVVAVAAAVAAAARTAATQLATWQRHAACGFVFPHPHRQRGGMQRADATGSSDGSGGGSGRGRAYAGAGLVVITTGTLGRWWGRAVACVRDGCVEAPLLLTPPSPHPLWL